MWRFLFLLILGVVIGSRALTERKVVIWSLLLGLLYGGVEVLVIAATTGWPSLARTILLVGLSVTLALPVYAIAELWRRFDIRASVWLRRVIKRLAKKR
jgi:hypothetical protein